MLVRDKFERRLTAVEEELRLQARLRAAVERAQPSSGSR
jgi:hypothetical protein